MANSEAAQMRNADYWDGRYSDDKEPPPKEWHIGYDKLEEYFEGNIYVLWSQAAIPKVVQLGSGSSSVPFEMFDHGYTDQTCVEFSKAVIAQMAPENPAIRWLQCDVRSMPDVESNSYDLAFDKATFFALCAWGPTHLLKSIPAVILEDTAAYSREVFRILKPGGVFCCVTLHEPRYVNHLLRVDGTDWEELHAPIALTPLGWAQTRAYAFRKPVSEATGATEEPPIEAIDNGQTDPATTAAPSTRDWDVGRAGNLSVAG